MKLILNNWITGETEIFKSCENMLYIVPGLEYLAEQYSVHALPCPGKRI